MSDMVKLGSRATMERLITRISATALAVLLTGSVHAEDETGRKLQDTLQKLEAVQSEADSWAALEKATSRDRVRACEAAIGSAPFCSCLNKGLNWAIGFETYVRVISAADAHPNPGATDSEGVAINSIFRAREKCVGKY